MDNRKELKQYLELLHYSGVDNLVRNNDNPKKLTDSDSQADESIKDSDTMPQNSDRGSAASILTKNAQKYDDCQKCELHRNRIKFVYGEGNPQADMMLIGEGPGSDENKQGRPFVGRAGQLLNKMLTAIHLKREDVYIANIVKCQPPGNRNPLPDEAGQCLPYLQEQIELVQPKLIVLLGKVAALYLLNLKDTLGNMRLRRFTLKGVPTYVTYHPAALLRNPSFKKGSWKDLQYYRDFLGIKPMPDSNHTNEDK